MSDLQPIPAKPIIVNANVAPAVLVQMVRMGMIIGASAVAGKYGQHHPTLATALNDPQVAAALGVALLNAAWSGWARLRLCAKLKFLANYVDDSVAVIKR